MFCCLLCLQVIIIAGSYLPSVLVPGLDLCVCQVESRGQVHAVLHAEVFLSLKAPLQLVELMVGKGCPCFARFFRAHRWTVSATGDFPVTFFFSPCDQSKRNDAWLIIKACIASRNSFPLTYTHARQLSLQSNFHQLVQTLPRVWQSN